MNLVKEIMNQLSGSAVGQLGSLLGTDAETTERAATAAVPSLLSVLAKMSSNDDGARKLTNVLGGLDTTALGNITQMLSGSAGSMLNKGTSLLGSLFGDSMTSGLATTLSRITGINSNIIKSLLAYLTPLVLGKVAAHWKQQGGNAHALKDLFAGQRDNIASAVPAGFSLADIPDTIEIPRPAHAAARTTRSEPVAASSAAQWLLPLALALVGGFILWQFMSRPRAQQAAAEKGATTVDEVTAMKPVLPEGVDVPSLASVRDDVTGLFKSLDTTFSDIRDAASAERAMPALREIDTKIDAMSQLLSRLPTASVTAVRPMIEDQVKTATEKANAVTSIEGIGADFKSLIQQIVAKITKWISADNR